LTDLWRAAAWLVPKVRFFTPASWQAFLGAVYLLTFFVWVIFAFIKPATFSKWNAERYARTLFQVIVKGTSTELAVVADEVARSAKAIVVHATGGSKFPYPGPNSSRTTRNPSKTEALANDILSLIADKRFCRAVVDSSPRTAWAFFYEMAQEKKYSNHIQTFATNIVNEAIENKSSFLYHEAAEYESGLMGHYKPISQAIFSNYEMVETIGTVLEVDFSRMSKWDSKQWQAYCRAVLMIFGDYVDKGFGSHSRTLYGAMDHLQYA